MKRVRGGGPFAARPRTQTESPTVRAGTNGLSPSPGAASDASDPAMVMPLRSPGGSLILHTSSNTPLGQPSMNPAALLMSIWRRIVWFYNGDSHKGILTIVFAVLILIQCGVLIAYRQRNSELSERISQLETFRVRSLGTRNKGGNVETEQRDLEGVAGNHQSLVDNMVLQAKQKIQSGTLNVKKGGVPKPKADTVEATVAEVADQNSEPNSDSDEQGSSKSISSSLSSSSPARLANIDLLPSRVEIWLPAESNSAVCRITNIYVQYAAGGYTKAEGTLLFPRSLKSQIEGTNFIKVCGISASVDYYDDDVDKGQHGERFFDFMYPLTKILEYHMPHFVRRFILELWVPIGVLLDDQGRFGYTYQCILANGDSCEKDKSLAKDYNFAFATQGPHSKTQKWVSGFISKLTPRFQFLCEDDDLKSPLFFRSAIFGKTTGITDEMAVEHSLFKLNNIDVHPALKDVKKCSDTWNILVTNRVSDHSRRVGFGRSFPELDDMVSALHKEAKRKKLHVDVNVQYFENKTYDEQVALSNGADVTIAPHGAGETNLIFGKQDALFVEVHVFGHATTFFSHFARDLKKSYMFTIAKPERQVVRTCLENNNMSPQKQAEPGYSEEKVLKLVNRFMAKFDEATKLYSDMSWEEITGPSLNKVHDPLKLYLDRTLDWLMACLRHQELVFDHKHLAKDIIQHISSICRK